jgi:hypothetical protein
MQNKICSRCRIDKPLFEFSKDNSRRTGYRNNCKICDKEIRSNKYSEDYHRDYRNDISNKLKMKEYQKQYKIRNKDKINSITAKRRALKLNATPKWLTKIDLKNIEEFYQIAQMFKLYTGQEYHVDHIVPLQGKNVCGLHVPWNLQILEASENIRKSNK